jgi:hypothetical protein
MRAMNARGRQVTERLSLVENEYSFLKEQDADIASWWEQGTHFKAELAAAMHGDVDPASVQERPIREWQAEGRQIQAFVDQRWALTAKWGREQGYTPEETVRALAEGERPSFPGDERS